MKLILALSLAINLVLSAGLYQYASDNAAMFADREEIIMNYESLLLWACDHGNGGHECGED